MCESPQHCSRGILRQSAACLAAVRLASASKGSAPLKISPGYKPLHGPAAHTIPNPLTEFVLGNSGEPPPRKRGPGCGAEIWREAVQERPA